MSNRIIWEGAVDDLLPKCRVLRLGGAQRPDWRNVVIEIVVYNAEGEPNWSREVGGYDRERILKIALLTFTDLKHESSPNKA